MIKRDRETQRLKLESIETKGNNGTRAKKNTLTPRKKIDLLFLPSPVLLFIIVLFFIHSNRMY